MDVRVFLLQTIHTRQQQNDATLFDTTRVACLSRDAYLSFLLSVLFGNPAFVASDGGSVVKGAGIYSTLVQVTSATQAAPASSTSTTASESTSPATSTRSTKQIHAQVFRMLAAFAATQKDGQRSAVETVATGVQQVISQLQAMVSGAAGAAGETALYRPSLRLALVLMQALGSCLNQHGTAPRGVEKGPRALLVWVSLVCFAHAYKLDRAAQIAALRCVTAVILSLPILFEWICSGVLDLCESLGRGGDSSGTSPKYLCSLDDVPYIIDALRELMLSEEVEKHFHSSTPSSLRVEEILRKLLTAASALPFTAASKNRSSAVVLKLGTEVSLLFGQK